MATDLQPDPSTSNRLRSWSNRQIDKLRRSPSRGHGESKESVFGHLGTAGVVGGAIGAPNLVDPSKQLQQDVRHGAFVFLQELERVASQPRQDSGAQRKGTIDLERDEETRHDVHPITSVDENPFRPQKDDASVVSNEFVEDIYVFNDDAKYFMRALLDTGSAVNMIHAGKVEESGFEVSPYRGPPIRDADGPSVSVLGVVNIQFHFRGENSARTWTLGFVVLRDPPFDIAFGRPFIRKAGLLKRSDVALPVAFGHQSKEEKQGQSSKTRDADDRNDAVKERERQQERARRDAEKRRREKDKERRK